MLEKNTKISNISKSNMYFKYHVEEQVSIYKYYFWEFFACDWISKWMLINIGLYVCF